MIDLKGYGPMLQKCFLNYTSLLVVGIPLGLEAILQRELFFLFPFGLISQRGVSYKAPTTPIKWEIISSTQDLFPLEVYPLTIKADLYIE